MYSDKLEVSYFSDYNVAKENFTKKHFADVILISTSIEFDVNEIPDNVGFAYFCDFNNVETYNDHRTIGKFQKIELIYREILSLFSDVSNMSINLNENIDSQCEVISFVSASGGVGSSSLAAAYALRSASKSEKVIYINSEKIGSTNVFFNAEGIGNFNNIIFSLKSKKSNLSLKLESEVKQSIDGVSFFDECKVALDKCSLSIDDFIRLIDELVLHGNYSKVIIDADFSLSAKCFKLLQKCNKIIFVSDGSILSNIKTEKALESIKIAEEQNDKIRILMKSGLIYNKFRSRGSQKISSPSINEVGGINRIDGLYGYNLAKKISEYAILDNI